MTPEKAAFTIVSLYGREIAIDVIEREIETLTNRLEFTLAIYQELKLKPGTGESEQ